MSKKSKRNRLISLIGVLAVAVVALFYVDRVVQAGDLQNATESTAEVANADTPWYEGAFGKKMILGAQADFRDPLY